IFSKIRGIFSRPQGVFVIARQIHLVNERTESPPGNFVYPGSDYTDGIEVAGQRVGQVDYGINPLGDRLYINMIEVQPEHRKQGIGLAVLWHLWCTHRLPIVPLDQRTSSDGFWYRARQRLAAAGAVLEAELRGDEQRDLEQQRWQHLVPEPENVCSERKYWAWVAAEHAAGRPAGPGIR
ncbi:GNAT family N-acetyltransferase, partial [Pseudomonas fluorescens]